MKYIFDFVVVFFFISMPLASAQDWRSSPPDVVRDLYNQLKGIKKSMIFIQNNLILLLISCRECATRNYVMSVLLARMVLSIPAFQQRTNIAR